MQAEFQVQAAAIKQFDSSKATDKELTELYGLYKQSTVGDINIQQPGMLAGPVARNKWNGWNAQKGTPQNEAMAKYVEVAKGLMNKWA